MKYADFVVGLSYFLHTHPDQRVKTLFTSPFSPRLPYKFGDEFSEELIKTRINLPLLHYLPTFEGVMQNTWHIKMESVWMSITCGRHPEGTQSTTPSGKRADGVFSAIVVHHKTGRVIYTYSPLGGDFDENINLDTLFKSEYENGEFPPLQEDELPWALQRAVNAMLYILSGEPDLREYKPPTNAIPRRQRDDLIRRYGTEHCVLVSWDWLKPKVFQVDSTMVSGHWRWQPCGEQWSKVKRIWIDSHVRTYGKEKE